MGKLINTVCVRVGVCGVIFIMTASPHQKFQKKAVWPQRVTATDIHGAQIPLESMSLCEGTTAVSVHFILILLLWMQEVRILLGELCTYATWHQQQGHILRQMLRSIIHIFIQRQHTGFDENFLLVSSWNAYICKLLSKTSIPCVLTVAAILTS